MFDVLLARLETGASHHAVSGRPASGAARAICRPARARCGQVPGGMPAMRRGLPHGRDRLRPRRTRRATRHGAVPVLPPVRNRLRRRRNHLHARLPHGRRRGAMISWCARPARQAVVALDEASRRLFGRSLKLRQVSAGGCNACEAETNVLGTVAWDLGRFGIQFVASPRHADGLLITGPVSENMRLALQKTYRGRALAKTGDRRGGLRDFRRALHRSSGSPQRRCDLVAGRPVRSRLSAPPPDHSRRPAGALGPSRRLNAPLVCFLPMDYPGGTVVKR